MKAKERIRVLYYYTPERAKEKEMSVISWFTLKMPAAGRAAPDQSRSQVHHLGHSPTPLLAAARALGTSSATFQDTLAGSWMGSKRIWDINQCPFEMPVLQARRLDFYTIALDLGFLFLMFIFYLLER